MLAVAEAPLGRCCVKTYGTNNANRNLHFSLTTEMKTRAYENFPALTKSCFYTHRITRGHCHHCHPGGLAFAGDNPSQRQSQPGQLPQQPQTGWSRLGELDARP